MITDEHISRFWLPERKSLNCKNYAIAITEILALQLLLSLCRKIMAVKRGINLSS